MRKNLIHITPLILAALARYNKNLIMNKLLSILIVLLTFWACTRDSNIGPVCQLSGNVNPAQNEYLAITYGEYLDSARIDKEGNFSVEIPVEESGFGMIFYNNRLVKIFIEAGKTLNISILGDNFPDKIDYSGDLGPINHYLQLSRRLDGQTEISSEELFSKEPQEFIELTDSIREKKDKLLNEYMERYPEMDSGFAITRSTDILYNWASKQLLFPGYYALVNNKIPTLPDNYHQDYLSKLNLDNPALLNSQMYKTFLENYLDYREAVYLENHPEVEKLWFPGSVARFRVIHEEFTDQHIKDHLLFQSMSDHLDNFGTEHIDSFITNFRVSCTNEEYKKIIEKKFSTSETLSRGKEAPELSFYNKEGEKIKLSDLKGKLLYINFWASWSEWSIQEFPSGKNSEEILTAMKSTSCLFLWILYGIKISGNISLISKTLGAFN